jgi:hypothetical protein
VADATREQIIRIVVENAQAMAQQAKYHASEQQNIKRTADAQAQSDAAFVRAMKAKAKAIDTFAKELERRDKGRLAATDREEKQYVAAVLKKLNAEKKIDAEKERASQREQARIKKEEDDYVKSVYKMLAAEKKLDDQKDRDAKKAQARIKKEESDYVRAVYKQLEAQEALEKEEKRAAETRQAGIASMVRMTAAFVGLQSAESVVGTFVDHFDKIRQYAAETADDVQRMRESLRELAALRGNMGSTGQTLQHVLELSSKTLQRPAEVESMEQAALGIGELAIGRTISKDEFDKSMIAAGKMQTLEGGSPDAYGQMVGQIALQSDHEMKSEEVEARLDRMFKIQQPGGFRTFSQAAQQYAQLNPLVMNKVLSPEKAMATLSAFSIDNPAEAATKTDQLVRATLANQIRSRGMKTSPDVHIEKTDKYFKSIGADKMDDPLEIAGAIADDIKKREAEAKAAGKSFNAYKHLEMHGFVNQQDILTIMSAAGIRNSGNYQKIDEASKAPLEIATEGKGPISQRFDSRNNDMFMQRRRTEIAEQMADAQQGVQGEPLQIALEAAHARLKRQGKVAGSFQEWRNAGWFERTKEDLFLDGKHRQVYDEAGRALRSELRAKGQTNDLGITNQEETLRGLATRVQESGGNLTSGVNDDMRKSAESIKQTVDKFDKAVDKLNGGPNGAPAAPPKPLFGPPAEYSGRPQGK